MVKKMIEKNLKTIGVGYASFKFNNIPFEIPDLDFHLIFSIGENNLYYARCLEYDILVYGNSKTEVIDNILEDTAKLLSISITQKNYKEIFGYRAELCYWKEYNQFKEKIKINSLDKISTFSLNQNNIKVIPQGKSHHSYSICNVGKIVLKETWFDNNAA